MPNYSFQNPYRSSPLLNSDPYTNLYLKQQAEKVAKEKAFDGYLTDLAKNVTPAGMRNQDVNGFTNKAVAWQKFGIENKKAIQNPALDGGAARSQFMGLHQELLGDAAMSKGEFEKSKSLQSIRNNPDIMKRVTPETLHKWSRSNKSIYDTGEDGFQSLDTTDVAYNAKPWEMKDENELGKFLLSNVDTKPSIVGSRPDPNDPYSKINILEYKHTPQTLQLIGERSNSAFESNGSFKDKILSLKDDLSPRKNEFDNNAVVSPPEAAPYHNLFKKAYGRDIQSDSDWARAYGLVVADKNSRQELPADNKGYAADVEFGRKKQLAAIGQGYRERNMRLADGYKRAYKKFASAQNTGESENAVNSLISEQYNLGKDDFVSIGGTRYEGRTIPVSEDIKKNYVSTDDAGNKTYPDALLITKDKKSIVPVFLKKDKDGKYMKTKSGNHIPDETMSRPFTFKEYKANLAKDFVSKKDWTDAQLDDNYSFDGEDDIPDITPSAPAPSSGTSKRTKAVKKIPNF